MAHESGYGNPQGGGGEMDMQAKFLLLPPEQQKKMLEILSGGYAGQQSGINKQMELAGELRKSSMPGGRDVRGGFVADHPGSAIASGINQGVGHYQTMKAMEAQKKLAADQASGGQDMMRLFFGGQQGASPFSPPNMALGGG